MQDSDFEKKLEKITMETLMDFCLKARKKEGFSNTDKELYDAIQFLYAMENSLGLSKDKIEGMILGLSVALNLHRSSK